MILFFNCEDQFLQGEKLKEKENGITKYLISN